MKIEIKRTVKDKKYTAGRMTVNGDYLCDTLEPAMCEPTANCTMPDTRGKAIPYGCYRITLETVSLRFSNNKSYSNIGYRLPRLLKVPGREGILIHPGNTVNDSTGCILVGKRGPNGVLYNSRKAFDRLYELMTEARRRNEFIDLTIVGGK